ncbi:MAG: LVIVD repeat-containing protein [Candidatus Hodarchaeota archaeon]
MKKNSKRIIIFGIIVFVLVAFMGCILISQITIPGLHVAYSVYVHGDHAFVTNNDGTVIIDISNPVNPRKIGIVATSDGAFGVTVKDDLAYIASDSDGFIIANISDPENPLIMDQYDDGGSAHSVCTNGSYAYVTEYPQGMEIFDISAPNNIIKVTEYDDGAEFRNVAIKNNFIYLTDSGRGLKVLNVTDPSSPKLVATSLLTHGAIDVYIHNDLLFLGCHRYGVYIFDISTPHSPIQLGKYYNFEGEAYGVTGNTTHLFVADLLKGVYSLNITDPSHPEEISEYINAAPHDIVWNDDKIFLADQDKELIILNSDLTSIYSGRGLIPGFEFSYLIIGLFISYLYKRNLKGGKNH